MYISDSVIPYLILLLVVLFDGVYSYFLYRDMPMPGAARKKYNDELNNLYDYHKSEYEKQLTSEMKFRGLAPPPLDRVKFMEIAIDANLSCFDRYKIRIKSSMTERELLEALIDSLLDPNMNEIDGPFYNGHGSELGEIAQSKILQIKWNENGTQT